MLLIKGKMELAPDPTEDEVGQERHLRDILAKAHDYDGVSTFPKIGKEDNKRKFNTNKKRQHSSPSSSCRGRVTKIPKVSLLSDDEEECNQQQQSPLPPPPPEPVTPPPPPRSPPPDDEDDRPPRIHRPKPPTDPRIQRQKREEAGRQMGFNLYVIKNVVRNMSTEDWVEFLTRRRYGMALIKELQMFLNEKYSNEECTNKQQHYRQLCNKVMYPLYYLPYERELSARQYHMQRDGEVPCMMPQKKTFIRRKFAGGTFPVHMSDDEYDRWMFTEREFCMGDHSEPTGYFIAHTQVENPAEYALRTLDECGNEVILRNTPRNKEQ